MLPAHQGDMQTVHGLRLAVTRIAVLALVLHALVPVGWMENTAAAAPATTLMPCPMMDGMAMPTPQKQPAHPAKHQLPAAHEGSICPFATATVPVPTVAPRRIEIARARFAQADSVTTIVLPAWDHIPRAPPPSI